MCASVCVCVQTFEPEIQECTNVEISDTALLVLAVEVEAGTTLKVDRNTLIEQSKMYQYYTQLPFMFESVCITDLVSIVKATGSQYALTRTIQSTITSSLLQNAVLNIGHQAVEFSTSNYIILSGNKDTPL